MLFSRNTLLARSAAPIEFLATRKCPVRSKTATWNASSRNQKTLDSTTRRMKLRELNSPYTSTLVLEKPRIYRCIATANRSSGFTLFELMIAVAVALILGMVAVPGFERLLRINHVATQVNMLTTATRLARAEAIKTGKDNTLCASQSGDRCDQTKDWSKGWILFLIKMAMGNEIQMKHYFARGRP